MESQFSRFLLDRYQRGESQSADEIWSRYARRLAGLVRQRLSDRLRTKIDSDDILQTAFFDFFKKADRDEIDWQKEGDLWRLLAAIATNHVKREVEYFSAAKRDASKELVFNPTDVVHAVGGLDGAQEQAAANKLNELLDFVLRNENSLTARIVRDRLVGKTTSEIAATTGRSERTVRRMLQMLKARLIADSEFSLIESDDKLSAVESENAISNAEVYSNYDLLKMVGAGAFGKVYLARDNRTDCCVAVKALKRVWLGDATAEKMFLNEAHLLASLQHSNVVKFLGVGPLPNGSWFIVMEYIEGTTLNEIVNMQHSENIAKLAVDWIRQIADAIAAMHAKGIVHGDLKPANVIVQPHRVCLVDFGFSWNVKLSKSKWRGGTAGYIAPERSTSFAADVFALGKCAEFIAQNLAPSVGVGRSKDVLLRFAMQATVKNPADRPDAIELIASLRDHFE